MFSDHCRTLGSHLEIRRGHLVAGSPKIHIVHWNTSSFKNQPSITSAKHTLYKICFTQSRRCPPYIITGERDEGGYRDATHIKNWNKYWSYLWWTGWRADRSLWGEKSGGSAAARCSSRPSWVSSAAAVAADLYRLRFFSSQKDSTLKYIHYHIEKYKILWGKTKTIQLSCWTHGDRLT